jgi:uncharacterized protein (TIGR03067 family)
MHLVLSVAAAISLLGFADEENAEKKQTDQQQIQGRWEVSTSEEGGQPGGAFTGATLVINGETLRIFPKGAGPRDALAMKYTLDATKNPKHLDTSHELEPGKPIKQLAIYELSGDSLKICLEAAGRGRPAKLETNRGASAHLLVLKRIKNEEK